MSLESRLEPLDLQKLATTNAKTDIIWDEYKLEGIPNLR